MNTINLPFYCFLFYNINHGIVLLFSQFNDAVIDHEEIKEFVAEPWFILLLAGVITLMVILLAAVLFVRYRQLGAKKSHLGGMYLVLLYTLRMKPVF